MIVSDAPRDCAYSTRTGPTMPTPEYAAHTASETASNVLFCKSRLPLNGVLRFWVDGFACGARWSQDIHTSF